MNFATLVVTAIALVVAMDMQGTDEAGKSRNANRRMQLVIGLVIAVALDTGVQILWKIGAVEIPRTIAPWITGEFIIQRPVFLVALAMMACQLINWRRVLSLADLSFARPFTALSYVTVTLASALILGEHVNLLQGIGIAVVVAGVWCVGRSDASLGALQQ